MKIPPLLTLNVVGRAIGDSLLGLPVQRHADRKAAWSCIANDVNGAHGLASGPLSDGLQALLSESRVAQSECLRLDHLAAVKFSRAFVGSTFI
jgi:hypothetical protein